MESDADLVWRCLAGETAAFGALVERHREAAVGFCCHQVGDFHAAQDLAQEVFLRAYVDLHALREPAKFGPWLRAIALRLCQSWHRRRRESPMPSEELDCLAEAEAGRELFEACPTRLVTTEALQALPEPQRQALVLKYLDGYSITEIAGLMGVPVETIRTRLRRARERLRAAVGPQGSEIGGELDLSLPRAPSPEPRVAFTRRVLDRVALVQMESGLTWPLYACLHALGKDWSLAYTMGITGTAFRFTVDERIADTGPTDVLDWDHWFATLGALGCEVTVFNAQLKSFSPAVPTNTEAEFHATQSRARDAVRATLDRGVPAIAWHPFTLEQKARGFRCEYGLLVGYDAAKGVYHVRLPGRAIYSVPWDGFGRADPVNWFHVIVFGGESPRDVRAQAWEAVRFAAEHARSRHPGHGLGGYETWLAALESGKIQPDGSPKAARLLRECREHAAAFLQEISVNSPETASELLEASQQYRQVSSAWDEYVRVFADAPADAAHDPSQQAAARQCVETAYAAEKTAVEALERAIDHADRAGWTRDTHARGAL
jgi:RNA polymerase sigma-70 factor (ECF subfamily)